MVAENTAIAVARPCLNCEAEAEAAMDFCADCQPTCPMCNEPTVDGDYCSATCALDAERDNGDDFGQPYHDTWEEHRGEW